MSNEIAEWLAQIRTLKQQLVETQRDRDAEAKSATNWRERYTTEAQQRRSDNKLAQQQIKTLKAQLQQLQSLPQRQTDDRTSIAAVEAEVAKYQTIEELKAKLKEVLLERDRLMQALITEQANHTQTRKSLTTVIGDTVDNLNKVAHTNKPSD